MAQRVVRPLPPTQVVLPWRAPMKAAPLPVRRARLLVPRRPVALDLLAGSLSCCAQRGAGGIPSCAAFLMRIRQHLSWPEGYTPRHAWMQGRMLRQCCRRVTAGACTEAVPYPSPSKALPNDGVAAASAASGNWLALSAPVQPGKDDAALALGRFSSRAGRLCCLVCPALANTI